MKLYRPFLFLIPILIAGLLYFKYKRNTAIPDTSGHINNEYVVGIYNSRQGFPKLNPDNITHYSVKWYNENAKVDLNDIPEKYMADKLLLITLEIFPGKGKNVLDELLQGTFDAKIDNFSLAIRDKKRVMVRFLPEMEVPVHEFPWQYQSPRNYINAFNYFAERLKHSAPAALISWSPSGYPGDSEFWPGSKYVDAISVTLNSKSERLSKAFPANMLSLNNKIHRMRYMDKPIFILSASEKADTTEISYTLGKIQKQVDSFKNTIYTTNNFKSPSMDLPVRNKLLMGAYDPRMRLFVEPEITIEHLFPDWLTIETGTFAKEFNAAVKRNHDVIVTVEPWKNSPKYDNHDVLKKTIEGKYDAYISELYKVISTTNRKVYLRWAHEMEIPIHRYAWQSQPYTDYINSFRYFINFQKRKPNILSIWGPAGDRGSVDWYPGDDVVDYVSMAIYGLPDKNITDQDQQESFDAIFQRKSYRMRFLNKPIFISEFGVKGTKSYKKNWLRAAALTINKNKQIFGICYFNLYDNPKVWGDMKAPDWSISNETFKDFCKILIR